MMPNKTEPLRPKFAGQVNIYKEGRRSIYGFDVLQVTPEMSEMLERQALDIFTQCSNSGLPLRESLSAILLSGIQWGMQMENSDE